MAGYWMPFERVLDLASFSDDAISDLNSRVKQVCRMKDVYGLPDGERIVSAIKSGIARQRKISGVADSSIDDEPACAGLNHGIAPGGDVILWVRCGPVIIG